MWVELAELVPWDKFEEKYAELFPSATGNVAKPFRLALGSLRVQNKLGCSDRELVEQIKKICEENERKRPRTYKREARKKYLAFAKKKRHRRKISEKQ